jgi:copper homeostasis protein
VDAGAHGVVVGALTSDGRVDVEAVRALVAAAEGREVTFHRALDAVPDVLRALDTLAALGVARVLTSGGEARSIDGLEQLRRCAQHVHDGSLPLQVQAGGGVRVADIAALVDAGVDAVHLSAKALVQDAAGPGGAGEYEVTDAGLVLAARDALDAALATD